MPEDRGSAIVLLTTGIAVLGVALLLVGGFVAVAATRTHASKAADLAALAAARVGSCEEAERVVRANGAELEACEADGTDFQVVAVTELHVFGQVLPVQATSRAGY